LSDDVSRQLALAGARVLGKGGEPDGGFKYEYTLGTALGQFRFIRRYRLISAETSGYRVDLRTLP